MVKKTPRPHQIEAIKIMKIPNKDNRRVYLCGDDMGLGKTGSCIVTINELSGFPCLIIVPSSLKINWQIEISEFTDKNGLILDNTNKHTWLDFYRMGMYQFFIVNYESLKKYFVEKEVTYKSQPFFMLINGNKKLVDFDYLCNMPSVINIVKIDNKRGKTSKIWILNDKFKVFKSVLIDECHRIKEPTSQQSKIALRLCYNKQNVIGISGTPLVNKVHDVINELTVLGWYNKKDYDYLTTRYLNANTTEIKEYGKSITGQCYFRRSKKEVGNFPEKYRKVVYVELEDREEYDKCLNDLGSYLEEYTSKTNKEIRASVKNKALTLIGYLKEISARSKLNYLRDFIKDCREKEEKLIVFGDNRSSLMKMKEEYKALSIFGSDSIADRNLSVQKFQNNKEDDLILCSLKAAGVGLTLTAARIVVFLQGLWHSAIKDQAEDRSHRIGQDRDVYCIDLIAKDTVEERIYKITESKRKDSNAFAQEESIIDTEFSEFDNFIMNLAYDFDNKNKF